MDLIKRLGRINKQNDYHYSKFKCPACNKEVIKQTSNGKGCKTCGCLGLHYNNFKHGDTPLKGKKNPLYSKWSNIYARCYIKKSTSYPWYGAKGIKMYDEWLDYREFKKWAIKNGYRDNLSIGRIDHSRNYEPSNCKWESLSKNHIDAQERRWTKHHKKCSMVKEIIDGLKNKYNLTYRSIAEIMGVRRDTVAKWGQGQHYPQNINHFISCYERYINNHADIQRHIKDMQHAFKAMNRR